MKRRLAALGALLLISSIATGGGAVSNASEPAERAALMELTGGLASGEAPAKESKLSWHLAQLEGASGAVLAAGASIEESAALLPKSARDAIEAEMLRVDGASVQVHVRTSAAPETVVPALERLGARVERTEAESKTVQAWLPIEGLRAAGALDEVERVELPDYAVRNAGSVTTQGDGLLNADDLRSIAGVDGTGVRIGVLSDGVEGLGLSQASGDLPAVNTVTCNEVPQSPTSSEAGAEGTAMLEIIHDLAPGAELWFGHFGFNFSGTDLDYMAAVSCLADNVDVVVDDIAFFNSGPYDGSSAISENASDALTAPGNRARAYYNAVGNEALTHYQGAFSSSGLVLGGGADTWAIHRYQGSGTTTDAGLGLLCEEGSPAFCGDTVVLAPGGILIGLLSWNDPYGASSNDYDIFLANENDASLTIVSADEQNGNDNPTEFFVWLNDTATAQVLDIVIGRYAGVGRTLEMFLLCSACVPLPDGNFGQPLHNFNTRCSSVPNNSDAGGGVVSLGAINAADPGTDTIEPYSSCGPTEDGRMKPDLAAVDGVNVTANGGFFTPFFGTSATGPHAAGIAALLLDCVPSLTQSQLRASLQAGAVDLGAAGPDQFYGNGRIDALTSATFAGCSVGPTPTPTVTPTATPTITPGPSPTASPTPPVALGDVSCDGIIDPVDALLILQWNAGLIGSLPCPVAGDVNLDGVVDAVDALVILQFLAGIITSLPP